MSISTEQLAQLLFGDPAPQGEAGTGAPMQSPMQPKPAPDPILAEVGSMVAQPAGDFRPQTVEYSPDGVATPQAAQLPPGGSASYKIRTSDSGFSTDKLNEIDKTHVGRKGMAGKFDEAEAKVRANYATTKGEFDSAYDSSVQATAGVGNAEAEKIMAEAGHMNTIAGIQRKHADAMKALAVDGALAAQKAKDEYRARLMTIPELNPSALWDEAGKDGQFAMGVAAFVHDFLGAKGIKTSAMDTINQAIKNKIDSQIYNINTKKEVAAGFKDLYNMTVAESATKMEVEAKLQGYYLKAVESGIKAQMGKIDSNVARAKMQLALTEVRKAQAQKHFEIDQHIEDGIKAANQTLVQMRGQDMTAATAKADREAQERIAQANRDAAKAPPNELDGVLFDHSESGEGVAARRFLPDVKEDKRFEVRQKSGDFAGALWGIRRLRQLHKEAGSKADWLGDKRIANEATRVANAMGSYAQLSLAYAKSGKQLSAQEIDKYEKMFANPTWFTNGDNVRILGRLQEVLSKEAQLTVAPHTVAIGKGDPLYGRKFGTAEDFFGGERAEGQSLGEGPGTPSRSDQLIKSAKAPDALEPMNVDGDQAKKVEYLQYTKPYWEDFKRYRPDIGSEYGKSLTAYGIDMPDAPAPKGFDSVRELAEDAFHKQPKARERLEALATRKADGSGRNSVEIKAMAEYFLDRLDNPKLVPGAESANGFGIDTVGEEVPPEETKEENYVPPYTPKPGMIRRR